MKIKNLPSVEMIKCSFFSAYMIAIPLKVKKKNAIKVAKSFFVKFQKKNKKKIKEEKIKIGKIPKYGKFQKSFITYSELFNEDKYKTKYKCWIIYLEDFNFIKRRRKKGRVGH